MSEWLKFYRWLKSHLGGRLAATTVGLLLVLTLGGVLLKDAAARILEAWLLPKRTPMSGPIDVCHPKDAIGLIDTGKLRCTETSAKSHVAVMDLPSEAKVAFDPASGTYFRDLQLRALLFLTDKGITFKIVLRDETGNEAELSFPFGDVALDAPNSTTGTGMPKVTWHPWHADSEAVQPSAQSELFPGYRTFSRPDYILLELRIEDSTIIANYQLVQSWEDHRSTSSIDQYVGEIITYRSQRLALNKIVSLQFQGQSSSGDARIHLENLETGGPVSQQTARSVHGRIKFTGDAEFHEIVVHVEPFGSTGLGRDEATAKVRSDGTFAFNVKGGDYEIWAETRTLRDRLYTGSCAFQVSEGEQNPWVVFHPRTHLSRALRSPLKLCEQGMIELMPSQSKDPFKQ